MTYKKFKEKVWDYYKKHGRDFPWRETRDPYKILVSEIMLQQTQTDRVIPKYTAWIKQFPNFKTLAAARLQTALRAWQGLGYNRRALALWRAAAVVTREYNGTLPKEYEKILALPGIGPYTAAAVLTFAFNLPYPFIETNIRTVYIHHFFPRSHGMIHDKEILELVKKTLDIKRPREWYYALMDYGAMLKKTIGNQNTRSRHYTKQSPFKGSNREIRSYILKQITQKPQTLEKILMTAPFRGEKIKKNVFRLMDEGFIKEKKGVYYIY